MAATDMTEIEVPALPESFLRTFYDQSVKNFLNYLCKRINDVNISKSSAINPHRRESQMGNVHKFVFLVLGRSFNFNERKENLPKSLVFNVYSVQRMFELFKKINLCRFHKTSDITIAAPWAYTTSSLEIDTITIEI